ncbi:MAG: hypothetical protein KJI72_03205 [Patescibacteria group bacterium]|nr:hypothetical protein [Patescibacteria group bacterium]
MEELEKNKKRAEQELSARELRGFKKVEGSLEETKTIMKWSPILHGVAAIAGILGVLALLSFWFGLATGTTFLGNTPEHAYDDAVVMLLVSIAFGIGTLIHQRQEEK